MSTLPPAQAPRALGAVCAPLHTALLLAAVGCGIDHYEDSQKPADTDGAADTDPPTDTDTDTDTDTTTGPWGDSGAGPILWYQATAQTADGAFVAGSWGTVFTDLADLPSFEHLLCDNTGAWSYVGEAPSPCPDCAWAFTLTVSDTHAIGEECAELGRTGGEWDGFEHAWGFSDSYTYLYGDYSFVLERVLWYYYEGGGYWFFLSYNYGGYGYNEGDATDMVARRHYY